MRRIARLALFVSAISVAGAALAQPVQLPEAQFKAQIAGVPATTETFEGFSLGPYPSPLVLANGTYTAAAPHIEQGAWCALSRCLGEQVSIIGRRSFAAFPPGTTHWGVNVLYASDRQVLRVTVIGNGGTITVDLPPNPPVFNPAGLFFGFADASGLVSVTFEQPAATPNYSFDNVVTAGSFMEPPSAIGVPTLGWPSFIALSVMLVAVAGFLSRHRSLR